jgi:hypothetical protein
MESRPGWPPLTRITPLSTLPSPTPDRLQHRLGVRAQEHRARDHAREGRLHQHHAIAAARVRRAGAAQPGAAGGGGLPRGGARVAAAAALGPGGIEIEHLRLRRGAGAQRGPPHCQGHTPQLTFPHPPPAPRPSSAASPPAAAPGSPSAARCRRSTAPRARCVSRRTRCLTWRARCRRVGRRPPACWLAGAGGRSSARHSRCGGQLACV